MDPIHPPGWRFAFHRTGRTAWTAVTLVALIAVCLFLFWPGWAYRWDWTGFGPDAGLPKYPHISLVQPAKSLWDWLQLLIVPLVLTGVGLWFTRQQSRTDLGIADDNAREAALQAYIDSMAALLLDPHTPLRLSKDGDEVRVVARTRTLTVLATLDGDRKRSVLQFLFEAALVNKDNVVISLERADMNRAVLTTPTSIESNSIVQGASGNLYARWRFPPRTNLCNVGMAGAYLYAADLAWVNLSGADLRTADLRLARLVSADLSGANLRETDLRGATLQRARLAEAMLEHANLTGTDLRYADLRGARLADALLEGAQLQHANLRQAEVTDRQLRAARSLKGATMPDGMIFNERA